MMRSHDFTPLTTNLFYTSKNSNQERNHGSGKENAVFDQLQQEYLCSAKGSVFSWNAIHLLSSCVLYLKKVNFTIEELWRHSWIIKKSCFGNLWKYFRETILQIGRTSGLEIRGHITVLIQLFLHHQSVMTSFNYLQVFS